MIYKPTQFYEIPNLLQTQPCCKAITIRQDSIQFETQNDYQSDFTGVDGSIYYVHGSVFGLVNYLSSQRGTIPLTAQPVGNQGPNIR